MDHGKALAGTKRGDALQIILIQVKGGSAAKAAEGDATRLRIVVRRHGVCGILLAAWKKGHAAAKRTKKVSSIHVGDRLPPPCVD
jgi:hypothetical protein